MEKIDPEGLLSITVDEFLDVLIVMHYLELTGEGMKQEPRFYAVDTDWCVAKLRHVQERVTERHVGVKNVSE
jgi:hypothetical protein